MISEALQQDEQMAAAAGEVRRHFRSGARRLASACAFGGAIAALIVVLGTRDLESYEHVFFSLDRGTAVDSVRVLGHPVYTLSLGFGVRLPLQGSLGSSPAARVAQFLPGPLTYWLLLTLAIAAAVLTVHRALEPLQQPWVAWLATTLLFCSLPMVAYTIYGDWPEVAVTYCAFVGCVFAPHALLAASDSPTAASARRLASLSVVGTVWGLVALSHPGYWPLVAVALLSAGAVALCRTDYTLRARLAVVIVLGAASVMALGLHAPDILRELRPTADADAMTRYVDTTARSVITAALVPFAPANAETPFGFLGLALVALLVGLTSAHRHPRRMIVGSAAASIVLSAATALSPGSLVFAPSNTWALRDPAAALAVLAATHAAVALIRSGTASRAPGTRAALVALALAAVQGPVSAATLLIADFPRLADHRPWTHDLSSAATRAANRGLPQDRVAPFHRLVLWPGVRNEMREGRRASTDFADAGYLVVTAWTKQRTMRELIEPNELLFNQEIDLAPEVLCDAGAVRFLQLRYLLRPTTVATCAPWARMDGLLVDGWLEVDETRGVDDRVRAVATSRLVDPVSRRPALSPGSTLLSLLVPLPETSLTLTSNTVTIEIADPLAATGQTLVMPVAYDAAWRASSGAVRNVGGLLALVGVDQRHVTIEFVPDLVAVLRAVGMTVAQVLACLGLIGLAFVGRVEDPGVSAVRSGVRWTRAALRARAPWLPPRRDWLYVTYGVGMLFHLFRPPDDAAGSGRLGAVLLPFMALALARLAQSDAWHRWIGGGFLGLALIRVAAGGSLSPAAVHDPLFWGASAAVALAISAATSRWRTLALSASAVAGACLATAMLLPFFPGVDSQCPRLDINAFRESFRGLADQLGTFATMCLLGVWLQAIAANGIRPGSSGRIDVAMRSVLLTGLLLLFSGAVSMTATGTAWMVVLGFLLGLAEARARVRAPALTGSRGSPAARTSRTAAVGDRQGDCHP